MSQCQYSAHLVLLNERWSQIQSGTDLRLIKVRNHSPYVCNMIYGKDDLNNKFP